jgi:riboflavin kinase/FMN adenylyltransferase
MGYPTANLAQPLEGYMPADGVYATLVTHQGVSYPAATSVGVNPTFGELTESVVESHLLDQRLDLVWGDDSRGVCGVHPRHAGVSFQ